MSFWVYILKCSDGSYYTGHTDNLERRVAMHREGSTAGYTASRLPTKLVFSEYFSTRYEALEMERRIKSWSRRKKEAMMRGDWNEVSRLARSRSVGLASQPAHGSTGSPRTAEGSVPRLEVDALSMSPAAESPSDQSELKQSPESEFKQSPVRPEPVEGQRN